MNSLHEYREGSLLNLTQEWTRWYAEGQKNNCDQGQVGVMPGTPKAWFHLIFPVRRVMNEVNVIILFLQMGVRTCDLCKSMVRSGRVTTSALQLLFFLFRFKRPLENRKMGPIIKKKFNQRNVTSHKKFFLKIQKHIYYRTREIWLTNNSWDPSSTSLKFDSFR